MELVLGFTFNTKAVPPAVKVGNATVNGAILPLLVALSIIPAPPPKTNPEAAPIAAE